MKIGVPDKTKTCDIIRTARMLYSLGYKDEVFLDSVLPVCRLRKFNVMSFNVITQLQAGESW